MWLTCLIWPVDNPLENCFLVNIDNGTLVMDLQQLIKDKHPRRLQHVDICDIKPWKCSFPIGSNLQETLDTVHFDATDTRLHHLAPNDSVSDHFATCLPQKLIQILVQVLGERVHPFNAESSCIQSDQELRSGGSKRNPPMPSVRSSRKVRIRYA
jgi:hypothetical protein